MKRKLRLLLFGLVFVMILNAATIAFSEPVRQQLTKESTIEQIIKRGKIRVGMSAFVPWAMKDKKGELIGFEVDVAKRLAKDLKIDAEFVLTEWSGIIPALLTGKFDVIIGGMTITPERNLKVNFTIPYDYAGQSLVTNKKLRPDFKKIEDFNRSDVTIACRLGATSVYATKKYLPKAKIRLFDTEGAAVQELLNGRADGFVSSAPLPAQQAFRYPDTLRLIEEQLTKELIGFAVQKGDPDTLNCFNNWIRNVENEGWLQERHNYWFKTLEWESRIK